MEAAPTRDSRLLRQARRRLAVFALISVGLHVLLLAVFQAGARRGPAPAPEPVPVQFVELEPPAPPEPEMSDIPDELPEQPPQEIPQPPEPRPEPAPEPQIPNEPQPEPEIPEEPAETPDIPAPEPSPSTPPPDAGVVTAPPPDDSGSIVVPGLTYRGRSDSALARFGHMVECAALGRRYDDDCADVGPVYLTDREIETLMPGGRLAPEIENYFRAQMAAEREREQRIERNSNAPMPNPNVCGDFACVPESGWGNLRDNPAVRRALEEAGID